MLIEVSGINVTSSTNIYRFMIENGFKCVFMFHQPEKEGERYSYYFKFTDQTREAELLRKTSEGVFYGEFIEKLRSLCEECINLRIRLVPEEKVKKYTALSEKRIGNLELSCQVYSGIEYTLDEKIIVGIFLYAHGDGETRLKFLSDKHFYVKILDENENEIYRTSEEVKNYDKQVEVVLSATKPLFTKPLFEIKPPKTGFLFIVAETGTFEYKGNKMKITSDPLLIRIHRGNTT